jgi:glycosyltransferase involved in cell wall biosynthesis
MAPVAHFLKVTRLVKSYVILLHGLEAWVTVPAIERMAARNARAVVSTTNYTATVFTERNRTNPCRNRVIPLCVSESRSVVKGRSQTVPKCRQEFTLLAVGRLDSSERQKGIDVAIEAMPRIIAALPGARLLVAGDGTDRSRIQALMKKLGVTTSVSLLGIVEDSVLQQLYRECDVMVLPSRQEGFGIVFLEAMSYGKPCIGASHGGIPEVIIDGTTGYLVPFGDSEALARCVLRLASESNLARRMGIAGFQQVLKYYCYESFCRNFTNLFDEMILERHRSEGEVLLQSPLDVS